MVHFHFLDALRAWMLLDLFFHAAWVLMPEYFWPAAIDSQGHVGFWYCFSWIHVFLMQVFFVIPGFFLHPVARQAKNGVVSGGCDSPSSSRWS